jgi:aspartate racemase
MTSSRVTPARARHIGVAGVSPEGALLCLKTIVEGAAAELPAELRPEVSLHMHPFPLYYDALVRGDWPALTALLICSLDKLRLAGAEFAVIPANVVHFAFADVERGASLPLLNLVEETATECARRGYRRAAVLGTLWTMRDGLYDKPLRERGIEPSVPTAAEQQELQTIISQELVPGLVRQESTARMLAIVERLKAEGSQAMVLACTELPLALNAANCGIAVIDTTRLLALRALAYSQLQAS